MNVILQFTKEKYETPLEMLDRLRVERPEYKDEKLSYLGRLDPLAHGMMLVAVGDANKEREQYLGLSKTYKVIFLFGVSTDTGDVLGLVNQVQESYEIDVEKIKQEIGSLQGKHQLSYPMYSSKTVGGKPLHEYAREGVLVDVPMRDMEIMSVNIGGVQNIQAEDICVYAVEATQNVSGDFRQEDIKKSWEKFLEMRQKESFILVEVTLGVTSGTYVRSLAMLLEKRVGIPCLAYDIERVQIDI